MTTWPAQRPTALASYLQQLPGLHPVNGLISLMFTKSKHKRREREIAEHVYSGIVEASRQPVFYTEFAVPDTIDGRFEMLSLHMFMALDGLVEGDDIKRRLAQSVMELFVRDMDADLREIGVSDIRVPKRMKALYGSFGGRIAGYTLAVKEGGEALHATLARNVYAQGGKPECVLGLAAYTQAAVKKFRHDENRDMQAGIITFPDPASFIERQAELQDFADE